MRAVTNPPAASASTAPDLTLSGGKPASVPGRVAWTFFEFGGGPYFVVFQVFVFATYFANQVVIDDPVTGQAYWAYAGGAAGLLIALASPAVGAIADQYGPRKPGVVFFALLAAPFMLAIWFAEPGSVALAIICFIFASFLFELAYIFHNAMLPAIAPANRIGLISASGYAMSYGGAIIAFVIWLLLPMFGIEGGADGDFAQERASGPLAAIFALLFLAPLLLLTPDTPSRGVTIGSCVRNGFASLLGTIRRVREHKNIVRFLIARMIYYDGLIAVFAFIGIFAGTVFGWDANMVAVYGFIIIVTAAISALISGFIDDWLGSKTTILISIACFSICLLSNLGTSPTQISYVFQLTPEQAASQIPLLGDMMARIGFDTLPTQVFLLVGIGGGLFIGPALSSSRTFMARLAPPGQVAEFFGLYNLTGRATAFLAPATIGLMTQFSGDQRAGLGVIFIFLGIGFALLLFVREPRRGVSP